MGSPAKCKLRVYSFRRQRFRFLGKIQSVSGINGLKDANLSRQSTLRQNPPMPLTILIKRCPSATVAPTGLYLGPMLSFHAMRDPPTARPVKDACSRSITSASPAPAGSDAPLTAPLGFSRTFQRGDTPWPEHCHQLSQRAMGPEAAMPSLGTRIMRAVSSLAVLGDELLSLACAAGQPDSRPPPGNQRPADPPTGTLWPDLLFDQATARCKFCGLRTGARAGPQGRPGTTPGPPRNETTRAPVSSGISRQGTSW